MVATLQLRKEALEAKIQEKTDELKRLCLQEADLTGLLPSETPLEPGEKLTIRRRVGTSFSFPQNLINGTNVGDDDPTLTALELECKVQTNIAEAALSLANDASANKTVRKKHRLMYRQSQRKLMELETRLSLLKQGMKPQPMKPQQVKKKPRPNTTAVDPSQFMREFKGQKVNNFYQSNGLSSWPLKLGPAALGDDELSQFSSLHRPSRSSGTSQSSNSPRLSVRDLSAFNCSGLPDQISMTSSLSQPNIQDLKTPTLDVTRDLKRSERRNSGRRQWDTVSAGGTLLPNQTYPDIHQPNLNRTQSLGSVDGQRQQKEKEWYETSLDSAPSPPLRTTSRRAPSSRLMYHLQEMQIRDSANRNVISSQKSHAPLTRMHAMRVPHVDEFATPLQALRVNTPPPLRADLPPPPDRRPNDAVYIDIPEDVVDSVPSWKPPSDGTKTPTQPYFHSSPSWTPSVAGMHPPHAVTQGEITFDTVVPFESPQNHTVVQAGIWQPYREVTKPFEMSDFYKYSTKFRQARQSPNEASRQLSGESTLSKSVEAARHSPVPGFQALNHGEARDSPSTLMGMYQPLRPMTCQPVESKNNSSYFDPPDPPSVSSPKIVGKPLMCIRYLSCYKKVPRPDPYKLISRPEYIPPSLQHHLATRIKAGGPISVADYMKAVLIHPRAGYYMKGDVFGEKGDFTTSPEISPLFGEMLGVWACHELSKIGTPRPMQIVELGPGRGTLTSDILRIFRKFPPGSNGISLHLVEVSERLAQLQASRLGVVELTTKLSSSSPHYQEGTTEDGIEILWYQSVKNVPQGFSLFLAHEFFDALPIHKFQKSNDEWREILVSLKSMENLDNPDFEFVLSRRATPTLSLLIEKNEKRDHVEICPEAADIMDNIAKRLEEDGGVALIIDYGHSGEKSDTFRAFRQHALHDPLKEPGSADLTADVDFSFLLRAAGDRIFSVGPTPQGAFLRRLGIQDRLEALVNITSAQEVENLRSGVKMVVEDMGARFQVLALFPAILADHLKRFPVSGFQD